MLSLTTARPSTAYFFHGFSVCPSLNKHGTMAAPSSRIKRSYTAPPVSERHGFPSHASSCTITPHPGLSTFRYSYLCMMPLDYPLGQYAWQRL